MKKLIYSLFILATTAMTFTSCEDVPAPFDIPTESNDKPTVVVDPAGSGTVADPYNVAAAIAYAQTLESGEKSPSNIYIKGKIASIREEFSSQFGNGTFSISDDGNEKNTFLIYRAMYLGNKKWTESDKQIQVGDEVIICGIVTNYNGTLETDQNKAYIYSLNGETAGGGGGGGDTGEAKGSGTLDDPYNPAGANAAASKLSWTDNNTYETTGDVYVKGKISRIADKGTFTEGGTYGNASFYISEDGKESGEFYCFRILYLGNKKFTSGNTDIKVGDEVIICGQLMNYHNNTPETVAGKAFLYSLNGKSEGGGGGGGGDTGEAKGSGTLNDPYNPAGAAAAVKNLTWTDNNTYDTTGDVYVKGKISRIADKGTFTEGGTYGNASFYISEDGKQSGEFYCFRVLYLGNKKFEAGNTDIKVGDEVIIYGQLMNYRGNTPETVAGKAYLYSLNGKTEDDGQGGGGGGEQTGAGSYDDPYSVSAAIAAGSGTGVYVKAFIVGYVEGQVLSSGAHFTAEGCDVKTNLLIAESASETDVNKCMPVQLPNGDVRTGLNLVDHPDYLGKEVKLYGNIEKYFGAPGVKSVTYAEIGGNSVGKKP